MNQETNNFFQNNNSNNSLDNNPASSGQPLYPQNETDAQTPKSSSQSSNLLVDMPSPAAEPTNLYTNHPQYIPNPTPVATPVKTKKRKKKIIFTIIGIIVGIILIAVLIISLTSASSKKLVCKSDAANITIMYNDKKLKGYKASGMSFDLDAQRKFADQVGIETYLRTFATWFKTNAKGTCTIDGAEVEPLEEEKNEIDTSNMKRVGSRKYGYVYIPKDWSKFQDIDGNTSLQYSYANVYIVSLNYFDDNQYSAEEQATNFMYNQQNANNVEGVSGALVKIGPNKEYSAYQVYMYYPTEGIYLITYWFEAEDGKVHYIALEGPGESNGSSINDFITIPETFSLSKEI